MKGKLAARLLACLLVITTSSMGVAQPVLAAQLGTRSVLTMEDRDARSARIEANLARADVREAMVELGVAPEQVEGRLAALTDDELRLLDEQLETLPAGGSILALIGAVFVVLIILDLTGVTNVFKKI